MSLTVCLCADTLGYLAGGGHMWVYLNWALGLRALGCRVVWLEGMFLRAQHFQQLTGNYSRVHFHHPGPVFLYVGAAGQWLFHQVLHVVPADFNGQVIAFFTMVVAAAEVVVGLAIIVSVFRTRRSASVDDANLLKY